MAERKKNKKQIKKENNAAPQNRAAQIMFVIFALFIILSMVLSSFVTY